MKLMVSILVSLCTGLVGCRLDATGTETTEPALDQREVCTFASESEATKCKAGQLAMFQPRSFGNEQLPVIAAATFCNFNYQIVQTSGAVLCVFSGVRPLR